MPIKVCRFELTRSSIYTTSNQKISKIYHQPIINLYLGYLRGRERAKDGIVVLREGRGEEGEEGDEGDEGGIGDGDGDE